MPNSASSKILALRSAAVTIIAVLLVALVIGYGLMLNRSVNGLSQSWADYAERSIKVSGALTRLQETIGYGGFIHNFKNFVLRRTPETEEKAIGNLDSANAELATLTALLPRPEDQARLAVLRDTLGDYRTRFDLARTSIPDADADTFDGMVRVDDGPALKALIDLRQSVADLTDQKLAENRQAIADIEEELLMGGILCLLIIFVAGGFISFLRHLSRQTARAQSALFQVDMLIDNAPEAILCVDDDGLITRVNALAAKLFDCSTDDLLNTQIDALLPPETASRHADLRKTFLAHPGQRQMGAGADLYAITKTGKTLPVDVSLAYCPQEDGRGLTLAAVRDISAQREAAQLLEEAKRKAENANALKSAFLASMSHEIRTPLTGLLGMADILGTTHLNAEQQQFVRTLKTSGRHLETVLNDILDLSKLEAGKLSIVAVPFSLTDLISSVQSVYGALATTKGLVLTVHGKDDALPSGALVGDPVRLRQILYNLVGNAVKFTNEGNVAVNIFVQKQIGAGDFSLRISIRDTGIGMTQAELQTIFDPFIQVDNSRTRSVAGTGLGLAICKRLVDMMAGSITVESEPGAGTSFLVQVPVARAAQPAPTQPAPTQLAPAHPAPAQPAPSHPSPTAPQPSKESAPVIARTLLVADDNAVNRQIAGHMLRAQGHEVAFAVDGLDAYEKIKAGTFDAVLLDIHMPKMDGREVMSRLRDEDALGNTRMIAFTADAMREHIATYAALGFVGFVSKPIDWERLNRILASTDVPAFD